MSRGTYLLRLPLRLFEEVKEGSISVEIYADKWKDRGGRMKLGDRILFNKIGTNEILHCIIINIALDQSVGKLLISQGIESTLSSKSDLEANIKSLEFIPILRQETTKDSVLVILI